jgi:hypothetical protein
MTRTTAAPFWESTDEPQLRGDNSARRRLSAKKGVLLAARGTRENSRVRRSQPYIVRFIGSSVFQRCWVSLTAV